jgi:hypothetical protein
MPEPCPIGTLLTLGYFDGMRVPRSSERTMLDLHISMSGLKSAHAKACSSKRAMSDRHMVTVWMTVIFAGSTSGKARPQARSSPHRIATTSGNLRAAQCGRIAGLQSHRFAARLGSRQQPVVIAWSGFHPTDRRRVWCKVKTPLLSARRFHPTDRRCVWESGNARLQWQQ